MNRLLILVFTAVLLLLPGNSIAAPSESGYGAKPAAQIPAIKSDLGQASPASALKAELTGMRYAVHTDAVTGGNKLRMVVDVSGPVSVSAAANDAASRLTVTIKGGRLGNIPATMPLDGKIAEKVAFSNLANDSSQLILDLPVALGDEGGYKVFTLPQDASANRPFRVVIDIDKPVAPAKFNFTAGLKNKVIVIDPGHGGSDPGAIGAGGNQEKAITFAVAQKVSALLERAGAKVIMTRRGDSDVSGPNASDVAELSARALVGNRNKADVFLSIHADSFANKTVAGTSTYYFEKSPYDSLLATNLQTEIIRSSGLIDRGVKTANFFLVKRTMMPAALIELGFISNAAEEKMLISPPFQQKMAQGIVQGLDKFFIQAAKQGGER